MPTHDEISDRVVGEISRASGIPRKNLCNEHTLKEQLAISRQNFVVLAHNLRSFIQQHNPNATLLVRTIETAGATVGSVVTLVAERIHG